MLTVVNNERLTRVGPGTPMGNLLRRYWQPTLLSSELQEPDGPPVRVRLLGEDLIAFRDTKGKVGLIDAYCSHRRAPMFYGRNEDCGLRCVYHGWKFDTDGNCTDIPAVPGNTAILAKAKLVAYSVVEKAGVIWSYMGPPEFEPPPPDYEWMRAPETHRFVSKNYQASNYLQALEGGLDTSHSTFLHNNVLGNNNTVRNADPTPSIEVFPTDYGYQYVSVRNIGERRRYVRVYNYILPFQQMRGDAADDSGARSKVPKIDGHFWVPIDDEQTMVWSWMYGVDEGAEITEDFARRDEKRAGRGEDDYIPGTFKLKKNLSNDHMIDRQLQKTTSFTGITGVGTQDMAVQEGMERIVDRSKELLIWTDKAIMAMRKMLLENTYRVERGETPGGVLPDTHSQLRAYDAVIGADEDWREAFKELLKPKW